MRPTDQRIREQLAPGGRQLLGVLVAGVAGSILVIAQAWAMTALVLAALDGQHLQRAATMVLAVFALRALTGAVSDALAAQAAALVGTGLRRRVVAAVLRRSATGGRGPASGELSVLATRGVTAAEPYLTRYLPTLVLAAVLPALTVVAIATQDLLSALIVTCTLPLVPVFGALVGLATRDRAQEQWQAMSSLSGHFLDVMRGLPTLVAHRRARAQSDTIREFTDRYRRASLRTLRLAFASSAVLDLVATLSVALVAVVVGVRLAAGHLDLHTSLIVLLLAPEAYWPLRKVGAEFHAAAEGVATFAAVDELVASEVGHEEDVRPAPGAPIRISDLTVIYPGRVTPALSGLSVTLPGHGVTVLTGPSGSGKSTLLAAVAGTAPRTAGSVTVAGRDAGGQAWREQIAWLPQRPLFVSGSIADNLRLAAPGATDADLWSTLRRVALEERVRALPDRLEASLDEDGANLSAGERARLALARIVLAGRPWVFLDEPTAHLDELTEAIIADTIVELGQTGAVVVVAHRPAIVELADRVVELTAPEPRPAAHPTRSSTPGLVRVSPTVPEPARAGRTSLLPSTLVGALASASGVALTATAGWLIVQASSRPAILTLLVAIVGVRTFGLARPVLRYVERLRSHDVALRMLADRRVQVYDALVPLTPGRLGRRRGDVLTSVVDDVDSVVDRELRVRMPARVFALVAGAASVLATVVLPAAGAAVALASLTAGGLGFVVARLGAGRAERASVQQRAALSAEVVEVVQVAPELVTWQAEERATRRVGDTSARLGLEVVRAGRWLGCGRAIALLVSGGGVAAVAMLAAPAVDSGRISGPMMALLVLLPLALAELAVPLADAGALSARTAAAAMRLHQLEHTAPAVRDTVARDLPNSSAVDLLDVSAGWDADETALRQLSLTLQPGERVGVVGESGSGKSTLAALLLRFLDPARGDVTLGGVPLPELALDAVRRVVGLVDDDPHVFSTTLVENVRLARPDAGDADVEQAIRTARLGPWLDGLPAGLDTWLGDGSSQVSGGERARIAIARSLLAEQRVLVLDEPTAHLDHATATELAHEILDGARTRSIVWITHGNVGLGLVDHVVDLGARRPMDRRAAVPPTDGSLQDS